MPITAWCLGGKWTTVCNQVPVWNLELPACNFQRPQTKPENKSCSPWSWPHTTHQHQMNGRFGVEIQVNQHRSASTNFQQGYTQRTLKVISRILSPHIKQMINGMITVEEVEQRDHPATNHIMSAICITVSTRKTLMVWKRLSEREPRIINSTSTVVSNTVGGFVNINVTKLQANSLIHWKLVPNFSVSLF